MNETSGPTAGPTSGPTAEPVPARFSRRQVLVLVAVLVTTIMMTIDITVVTVALPVIAADLGGGSGGGLQWVIIGYTIGFGSLLQIGGTLSDTLGVRRLFLVGIAGFTAFSVLCGFSVTLSMLNLARVLQGVAGAVMFAGIMPLIARTFDEDVRARAIGYWSGVVGVAGVLAPVFGGVLVDVASWRWMFWINVPVGIVAVVLIWRYVPVDGAVTRFEPRSFDFFGATLLAAGLAALNFGLVQAQSRGWGAVPALGGLLGALVLLLAFGLWERRVSNPILDVTLLRERTFGAVATLALLNRVATVGAAVYLVLLLQQGYAYSAAGSGLLFLPLGAAAMVASVWAGKKLQERIDPAVVLATGFGALAVASVVLAWQIGAGQSPLALLPALVVWGAGNGLANAPIMAVTTAAVPLERVGMATGLVNSFFPIGAGVGTAVLGTVFAGRVANHAGGPTSAPALAAGNAAVFLLVAVLMGVATAVALTLLRRFGRGTDTISAAEVGD